MYKLNPTYPKVVILKNATIGTTTLHYTICTRIARENYNNNDQQFYRHDVRRESLSWPIRTLNASSCF